MTQHADDTPTRLAPANQTSAEVQGPVMNTVLAGICDVGIVAAVAAWGFLVACRVF